MFLKRKNVSIFGIRAVGKSSYLAMLIHVLSHTPHVFDFYIPDTVAAGYITNLMRWILRGEGPPPSKVGERMLIPVRIKIDRKNFEIKTYDLAGEDIERMGETFKQLIDIGDGYIFLIEPTPDPDKKVTQVWLIYRFVEYLTKGFSKKVGKPVAFTFTKNDIYNIKNAEKHFWEYTGVVFNLAHILNRLKKYAFFAVSAFGGDLETLKAQGKQPKPIDVEKPFFWVINNL